MKKVLILHTATTMGGAEYSLLELLRNLDGTSDSVHVIASIEQILFKYVNLLPVRVHDIYLPFLHRKRLFNACIELAKASVKLYQLVRKEKIQVVYCNTFRSLPFCLLIKLMTCQAAKLLTGSNSPKPKIVCHCRDHIPFRFMRFITGVMADECIAVSNDIFRELPRSSKNHIIHNGVNPLLFQTTDTAKYRIIKQYRLPDQTRIIGNIGQIISWKNQQDFLAVAASLLRSHKNLHFFLVGTVVDNDYFLVLKKQIQVLGLEQYITFTGHVENIADYLSAFTLVLHTAHSEPFGRVLIEAGASGIPVVAYSSGGPSEIIDTGRTGFLVKDGNIEEMAELTTVLLDNPNLLTIMGKSARKHVTRHFNSKDYARKVYNTLTNNY